MVCELVCISMNLWCVHESSSQKICRGSKQEPVHKLTHFHTDSHARSGHHSDFFDPRVMQEAQRQAAWQQYYQYQAYMQSCLTPEQYQQWHMAQHYQYMQQNMSRQQQPLPQQQQQKKVRKPRVKKEPVAVPATAAEPIATAAPIDDEAAAAPVPKLSEQEISVEPVVASPVTTSAVNEPAVGVNYEEMSRSDVVAAAKERAIKANGKTADIIKVSLSFSLTLSLLLALSLFLSRALSLSFSRALSLLLSLSV